MSGRDDEDDFEPGSYVILTQDMWEDMYIERARDGDPDALEQMRGWPSPSAKVRGFLDSYTRPKHRNKESTRVRIRRFMRSPNRVAAALGVEAMRIKKFKTQRLAAEWAVEFVNRSYVKPEAIKSTAANADVKETLARMRLGRKRNQRPSKQLNDDEIV